MASGSRSAPTDPLQGEPHVHVRLADPADAPCIGQLLFESIQAFDYRQVSAIAIVIVVAVTLIDMLSQAMRKRLL